MKLVDGRGWWYLLRPLVSGSHLMVHIGWYRWSIGCRWDVTAFQTCMCVLLTWNRSSIPVDTQHTQPVPLLVLHAREIQASWSEYVRQIYHIAKTCRTPCNRKGDAMTKCWIRQAQQRTELRERDTYTEREKKKHSTCRYETKQDSKKQNTFHRSTRDIHDRRVILYPLLESHQPSKSRSPWACAAACYQAHDSLNVQASNALQ